MLVDSRVAAISARWKRYRPPGASPHDIDQRLRSIYRPKPAQITALYSRQRLLGRSNMPINKTAPARTLACEAASHDYHAVGGRPVAQTQPHTPGLVLGGQCRSHLVDCHGRHGRFYSAVWLCNLASVKWN